MILDDGNFRTVEDLYLPGLVDRCRFRVRSKVWDYLHGHETRTHPDIDIIYFNPKAEPIEDEKKVLAEVKNKSLI